MVTQYFLIKQHQILYPQEVRKLHSTRESNSFIVGQETKTSYSLQPSISHPIPLLNIVCNKKSIVKNVIKTYNPLRYLTSISVNALEILMIGTSCCHAQHGPPA